MDISIIKRVIRQKKVTLIITLLTSVIFGACYMLTPAMAKGSTSPVRWYQLPLGMVIFLGLFAALVVGVHFFRKGTDRIQLSQKGYRIFYAAVFLCNVLTGLLFLLVYHPGTGNYDTLAILKNDFGMARQHPSLYIAYVYILREVVFFLGGGYQAVFVVNSILTIVLMSFAYTYLLWFLKRQNVPFLVLLLIGLFYTFCPIFNLYKVTFLKDVPFSVLLLLWVPILFDTWKTKGENLKNRWTMAACCLYLILSLMRGNGIYISVVILICMLILARKMWKRLAICAVALIIASTGLSIFEGALGVEHLFKETVGIPLQQMAATVYYGGEVTEEQAAFIDQVIPLEFIQEKYDPYTSVPLKWSGSPIDDDFLYEHKGEFLKVWAQMLVPNFKIYVKSYLQASYGFWSLGPASGSYRYTSLNEKAFEQWLKDHHVSSKELLPADTQAAVEWRMNRMIQVPGEGICFWAMIVLMLVMMWFDGWKTSTVSSPMLAGVLTVFISTPLAYSWRYILFIPLYIPILIGLLLRRDPEDRTTI